MTAIQAAQARFPMMNVGEVSEDESNALLVKWEHPLGPCERPFGQQGFVLDVFGEPVALAVSASTVSSTVHGYRRNQVVELARIARHPDHPGIMRVMLRLWRAYLAEAWPYWRPAAAISYAMPGTKGDLYRFDGWENWGKCKVSRGGGTWTLKAPKVSQIGDGVKTLWGYRFEGAAS
ncbi:MAG: hypothetical protein GEU73_05075 [Chloroflexi bacterium]|nr:hypothetical protein [Chloroflexota bacterium]